MWKKLFVGAWVLWFLFIGVVCLIDPLRDASWFQFVLAFFLPLVVVVGLAWRFWYVTAVASLVVAAISFRRRRAAG